VEWVHGSWTGGAPGSTVDRGGTDRGHGGASQRAACGRWSLPVLTGDGGGGRAGRGTAREVLTGAWAVAKRRRNGGSERWQLELVVRAKEGAKELRREGMRCGEGQGSTGEGWLGGG
jgi:hypothetical protein